MLHSGGPAVIQTLVRGVGMAKRRLTARSRLDSGWPCGLVADTTEQACCSVLDPMARGSEGLNHFRLANDDPQKYPETG